MTVGSPNFYVGGLVGYNEGAIAQAYAVGAVSGQHAGGLAGYNQRHHHPGLRGRGGERH